MEEEKTKFKGNGLCGEKECIGTVVSDSETPTFEVIRVKLRANKDVKPGTLLRIPTRRNNFETILIARVKSAHEFNPNEDVGSVAVRDSLQIEARYPTEEDSTTIFRLVEADLIEELSTDEKGEQVISAPETLPNSGVEVFLADPDEIVSVLGFEKDPKNGLHIGETTGGVKVPTTLKSEVIQRHIFIGGTTGSGKSYAMGVITEELIAKGLPVIFIDTQDEYYKLVDKLGGVVKSPGNDFTVRISSLTEKELVDLIPVIKESSVQTNIVLSAFGQLKSEILEGKKDKFSINDIIDCIDKVGPELTKSKDSVALAKQRTGSLRHHNIFGEGISKANWPALMIPCMSIRCKHLTSNKLQIVATAVLRELQDLRLRGFIPPYAMVIDEAHLFVPQGENSACKQIIREGVRIGRHHGISIILLTQSPVDIDKSAIRQCNTRLVFALEKDQLDAIQGVKADATDEMLRALPKMPRGTCLLSGTYETVKHTIPVKIRTRKTEDSEGGKTPPVFDEMKQGLEASNSDYKWSKYYHAAKEKE